MRIIEFLNGLTINTQSSIRIVYGSRVLRLDPFLIREEPHDSDVILVTHEHYDHFSPEDIKKVVRDDTTFIFPRTMEKDFQDLRGRVIPEHCTMHPMDVGETLETDGIKVRSVPAYNKFKTFHPRKNRWLGYIIDLDGLVIYDAGDTDSVDDLKDIKCDVAFVPVGGTFTMAARDAAALVNKIHPELAIPIHYGSLVGRKSDGEVFQRLVDPDIRVVLKL